MTSIQGARTAHAAVLTAVAMIFLLVVGLTVGKEAAVVSALTMPVGLLLLWLSADVVRADEKQLAVTRVRPAPASTAAAAGDIGGAHSLNH